MLDRPAHPSRSTLRRLVPLTAAAALATGLAVTPLASAAPAESAAPTSGSAPTTPASVTVAPAVERNDTGLEAHVERDTPTLTAATPAPGTDGTAAARVTTEVLPVATFRGIGISLHTAADPLGRVRVHTSAGWGDWTDLSVPDSGPTPGSAEDARADAAQGEARVSEMAWVGEADGYALDLRADAADVTVELSRDTAAPPSTGTDQAQTIIPVQGQPPINPRSSWGARSPKVAPEMSPSVRFAIVHHSVSSNDYAPEDVPGILRSIQAFHMDSNGWDDIGYNFAIDKYGRIWEGRSGGIDRAVYGAHAFTDNYQSSGIVAIGDFRFASPTPAMLDAYGRLIAWKLNLHGWKVNNSWAGRSSIVGHRDVNQTECPGPLMYAQLGAIRASASSYQAQFAGTSGFWGAVTLGTNPDGRIEAFASRNSNEIQHNWQTGPSTWSGWYPLLPGTSGRPAVITNADGRLEVFGLATNGALWHIWQSPASASGWSAPASLGGSFSTSAGIGLGRNPDGRLEAFVLGDDDELYHIWQAPAAASGWSGYASLGGSFPSNAGLVAANNADGRLEIFSIGDGNVLQHTAQSGGFPSGWGPVSSLVVPMSGDPAVGRNADGRLEVFGVDDVGRLWHVWQRVPNGTWASGQALADGFEPGSPIEVVSDQNKHLQAFGTTPGGELRSMWQTPITASGWNGFLTYGGATIKGAVDVAVRSDQRLVTVGITRDGTRAVATTQNTPNGTWSSLVGI